MRFRVGAARHVGHLCIAVGIILGTALATTACDRRTSVGAVGGTNDGEAPDSGTPTHTPAELCTSSGGAVTTESCCLSANPFPDTCNLGPCGCALANAHAIDVCQCPTGGCYVSGVGCVGATGACTQGMALSCNEDPTAPAALGQCMTGNRCFCISGTRLSATGRCQ